MESYVLSIDNGLTTIKASLFSLAGKQIASHTIDTRIFTEAGRSEIDMDGQWQDTACAIRSVIEKSGIPARCIIGVGNSGHGAGLYCIDAQGRPVRRAITSMDTRAESLCRRWREEGRHGRDRLYQDLWSGQAIPLLAWLRAHEPDAYARTNAILMAKDWIKYKLTGEAGIEYTDASNNGLVNLNTRQIDTVLPERFGIPEISAKIPALHPSAGIIGRVTRDAAGQTMLPEGIPVIGGMFDCVACSIGSGECTGEAYSIIAGTWNINSIIGNTPHYQSETMKCSLFADADRCFYVESSATSAVNLQWFMDRIIKGDDAKGESGEREYRLINKGIEDIPAAASRLIYLPFLYASNLADDIGACFIGLRPEHTAMHMVRALYEGVAFAHKKHIMRLRSAGHTVRRSMLSGGASNSPVWCQIMADVLEMDVYSTASSQTGALGTAICTAVALGVYEDLTTAADRMVSPARVYEPNRSHVGFYHEQYEKFNRCIDRLGADSV